MTLLTDRAALLQNRARTRGRPESYLLEQAAADVHERLSVVNKSFTDVAIITGFPDFWATEFKGATIVEDSETLNLEPARFDLVLHMMALHWANDPVGQLIQCRRALRPDGLMLATLFGGQTLTELRTSLAEAETTLSGGLSPRVAPMAEIRDLGALLQRAGFALPVADSQVTTVTHPSLMALLHDLRAMGEANALHARNRRFAQRNLFTEAEGVFRRNFSDGDKLSSTFEIITLTGWAPSPDQPQPLRPGSAAQRLADALDTTETPLPSDEDATTGRH